MLFIKRNILWTINQLPNLKNCKQSVFSEYKRIILAEIYLEPSPKLLDIGSIFLSKPWVKIKITIIKYELNETATYQNLCAAKAVHIRKLITNTYIRNK